MEAAKRQATIRRAREAEEAAAAAAREENMKRNVNEETRRRWELHNEVELTSDAYFAPDLAHMEKMRSEKPWRTNANYFTEARVSALAALKMFIHAKRGGPDPDTGRTNWFEVMGLMMGHYKDNVIYITDTFGLPVEASEVECSMTEASQVYMVEHMDYHRRVGKPDKGCLGWYHSHPGYTCFLSGIDVATQRGSQLLSDPYLAVVVDPVRTIATGRLDLKAFRTYTQAHVDSLYGKAEEEGSGGKVRGGTQFDVPEDKIKDFGVHAHHYYEVPITIYRSRTDEKQLEALLSQYWSASFTTNSLLANRDFASARMSQLVQKLPEAGLTPSQYASSYNSGVAKTRHDLAPVFACPADPSVAPWSVRIEEDPDAALQRSAALERGSRTVEARVDKNAVAAESKYRLTALTNELLLGGLQSEVKEQVFNSSSVSAASTAQSRGKKTER